MQKDRYIITVNICGDSIPVHLTLEEVADKTPDEIISYAIEKFKREYNDGQYSGDKD